MFSLELLRLYNYLFQQTSTRYAVVHALDGYDELSLTGTAKVVSADPSEEPSCTVAKVV